MQLIRSKRLRVVQTASLLPPVLIPIPRLRCLDLGHGQVDSGGNIRHRLRLQRGGTAPALPGAIGILRKQEYGRPRPLQLSEAVGMDGKIHGGEDYSSS